VQLHLGVVEIPYAVNVPSHARRVAVRMRKGGKPQRFSAAPSGGETTGDIATILEAKYHIMEIFWEEHQDASIKAFEEALLGALENIALGAPSVGDALAQGAGVVETLFHQFISEQQMDGLQPGVPTKAALAGISHRLLHPYAKSNPARPSFRDTGLYMDSFKAWVTT
jgi:hypothetical protein